VTAFPVLSALVALPIAGAIVLLFVREDQNGRLVRSVALATSVAVFAATLLAWSAFDPGSADFQLIERHQWIPAFGITYFVGVDGVSLLLLVLTGVLTPLALLGSWESIHRRTKAFCACILLLESAMMGVFVSLDLFLFYVFWDAMLIPMYFLIGIWGYERRVYAAVKFILFTMSGSLLMLLAIVGLAHLHNVATGSYSFDLLELYAMPVAPRAQFWFFLAFALAFAIKVPLFPFHTWLPDAHVEAPTAGSVLLAGVLLKMGAYGLVRFAFPLFPMAATFFAPYLATLATIGIVYGALVAMVQPDLKKLVAYSSISHMGLVVLGIASMNIQGLQGGVFQMLSHGVTTGGLFLIVGMLSDRRHTRLIAEFGGLKSVMPHLVAAFLVVTLASIGLPGLSGFVGEFLVLLGALRWSPRMAACAATGAILSATYMLWMFQRVNFGPVRHNSNALLPDLRLREWAILVPIVALTIVMGVVPNVFLRPIGPSVARMLNQVHQRAPERIQARTLPGVVPWASCPDGSSAKRWVSAPRSEAPSAQSVRRAD
jgi:NADH-quinone oxidoreductase subunit M